MIIINNVVPIKITGAFTKKPLGIKGLKMFSKLLGIVYIALLATNCLKWCITKENRAKIDHFTLFIKYDYTLATILDAILNMSECMRKNFWNVYCVNLDTFMVLS